MSREVKGVVLDGVDVKFTVSDDQMVKSLPASIVSEFNPRLLKTKDEHLLRRLRACGAPRALALVPWHPAGVPHGCAYLSGAAYILPADMPPEGSSFFPLNWSYGSGFAMVEIEPVLDEASKSMLSVDYFMTRRFQLCLASFSDAHRGENAFENLPGASSLPAPHFIRCG
jgi:hypothetical protein